MRLFYEDEFTDKRLLSRLKKNIEKEELDKTIEKISYLNEIQNELAQQLDLGESENEQLQLLKKLYSAKNARKNLQA